MRFHLPKPLHGWRAFVGEVGIIVLGVLIALGAEQAIEGVHDRQVAAQSRRDVREEVGTDVGFYRERLIESGCVARRLSELSAIVQRGAVQKGSVNWVGRPNDFAPFSERWRAVTASARSTLFPPSEQFSLDAIYGIFGRMDEESKVEQDAWTNLNIAAQLEGPIDSATRLTLLRSIEQARRTDSVMKFAAYYALFHARRLGIASNPDTSPKPGDVHSVCLPIATRPDEAEKLLQPRNPR
jgi:hypothetical protein